jgi:translation initiation factor 3 subunit H
LKIVKHCNDNLPVMVAGSLLGLDVDGILEVTYCYPFPTSVKGDDEDGGHKDEIDGQDYQIEMMKMLRDVNMDNNCVGWYQSSFLGTYSTNEVVAYQENYQSAEDLSDNSVVIIFDPIQTQKGHLSLKAFRLSDEYMALRKSKKNGFVKPSNILIELPIKIKNSGYMSGYLASLSQSHSSQLNCSFDSLSLAQNETYLEKHLELLTTWTDDYLQESTRFQQYGKAISKPRQDQIRWLHNRQADNVERAENGESLLPITPNEMKPFSNDPPGKMDSLLILGQMNIYTKQIAENIDNQMEKVFSTQQLYK